MSNASIRVIAQFAVRLERVDEFIAAARAALLVPTRSERGCLQYDLWQDAADPTRFAMVEAWESEEALAAHLAQPSLRAAVARLTPLAAEPPRVARFRAL
jgi:quinol monooxygenase YgiN